MVTDARGRRVAAVPITPGPDSTRGRKNHVFLKAARGEPLDTEELALLSGRTRRRVQQAIQAARAAEQKAGKRMSLRDRAVILAEYLIDPDFAGDLEEAADSVREMGAA